MGKRQPSSTGDQPTRRVVCVRIRHEFMARLKVLAASWRPPTNVTQLFDLAIEEFLDKHERRAEA